MNKSQKILALLKKNKSIKEIAKTIKVKPAYVYYVRWTDQQKSKKSVAKKKPTKLMRAAVLTKQELDALLPPIKTDLVNKPPHYTTGGVDFLDFAEAKNLTENAYLFNVVKYVTRCGKKEGVDPVQDLQKARFYLDREINRRKEA